MRTALSFLLICYFQITSIGQSPAIEVVNGLKVIYSEPGAIVGFDEDFNHVSLNTQTMKQVILFEYGMSPGGLLVDGEQLTMIVQNGSFYASKSKYDPKNIVPEIYTDDELASQAIVKYSIDYLRLKTAN